MSNDTLAVGQELVLTESHGNVRNVVTIVRLTPQRIIVRQGRNPTLRFFSRKTQREIGIGGRDRMAPTLWQTDAAGLKAVRDGNVRKNAIKHLRDADWQLYDTTFLLRLVREINEATIHPSGPIL